MSNHYLYALAWKLVFPPDNDSQWSPEIWLEKEGLPNNGKGLKGINSYKPYAPEKSAAILKSLLRNTFDDTDAAKSSDGVQLWRFAVEHEVGRRFACLLRDDPPLFAEVTRQILEGKQNNEPFIAASEFQLACNSNGGKSVFDALKKLYQGKGVNRGMLVEFVREHCEAQTQYTFGKTTVNQLYVFYFANFVLPHCQYDKRGQGDRRASATDTVWTFVRQNVTAEHHCRMRAVAYANPVPYKGQEVPNMQVGDEAGHLFAKGWTSRLFNLAAMVHGHALSYVTVTKIERALSTPNNFVYQRKVDNMPNSPWWNTEDKLTIAIKTAWEDPRPDLVSCLRVAIQKELGGEDEKCVFGLLYIASKCAKGVLEQLRAAHEVLGDHVVTCIETLTKENGAIGVKTLDNLRKAYVTDYYPEDVPPLCFETFQEPTAEDERKAREGSGAGQFNADYTQDYQPTHERKQGNNSPTTMAKKAQGDGKKIDEELEKLTAKQKELAKKVGEARKNVIKKKEEAHDARKRAKRSSTAVQKKRVALKKAEDKAKRLRKELAVARKRREALLAAQRQRRREVKGWDSKSRK